jgi:hypothetical protein
VVLKIDKNQEAKISFLFFLALPSLFKKTPSGPVFAFSFLFFFFPNFF